MQLTLKRLAKEIFYLRQENKNKARSTNMTTLFPSLPIGTIDVVLGFEEKLKEDEDTFDALVMNYKALN